MSDSTELDEDLEYLQIKYSTDSGLVPALKKSPASAQKYIQSYKQAMYIICPLFMLLGITLIVSAFLLAMPKIGIVSSMVGAVTTYHFFSLYFKMKKTISEVEKIARYHHLI